MNYLVDKRFNFKIILGISLVKCLSLLCYCIVNYYVFFK